MAGKVAPSAEHCRNSRESDDLTLFEFELTACFLNDDYDYTLDYNVTGSYVETEILCPEVTPCAANEVRRSNLEHFTCNWTFIDATAPDVDLLFGELWTSSAATTRGIHEKHTQERSASTGPSSHHPSL